MTLHVQFLTMGVMFASGTGMGILFDLYRILTGQLRVPRWAVALFDLVYWLLVTLLVFQMLYSSNQGQLRLFVFIGLFAGATFYWLFLRVGTIKAILFAFKVVNWFLGLVEKIIHLFIVQPIRWLYKGLLLLISFLMAFALFAYKIVVQLLYPVVRLLGKPIIFLWRKIRWPSWIKKGWESIRKFVRKWFAKK